MNRALLPLLLALILLAGCGGDGDGGSGTTTRAAGCETVERPSTDARELNAPSTPLDAAKIYDVVIETNCGTFTIRLDQNQSPHAAASFASLVDNGYFDDTIFHRIVPGFVIQGGDPTASGQGGPGYSTVDEVSPVAAYKHGVVAMAKTQVEPAGTAGSQFFVVTAEDAGLTPDYAILGTVTDGLAVIDRIGKLGGADEQPTAVVKIENATVKIS
jgi:cyclophilin family peptidyl-prolyl cis-trans isomerase